jgi:hypothetical protein
MPRRKSTRANLKRSGNAALSRAQRAGRKRDARKPAAVSRRLGR